MRRERGMSVSVEAVLILPALVLFVLLLVTLARLVLADHALGAAATSAARTATLAGANTASAKQEATRALAERDVRCKGASVSVSRSAESVTVQVSCQVDLADISLPLLPGSVHLSTSRTSAIDPARSQ